MVGLEGEGERVARAALAELQREVEELRRRDERHSRWLDALAALAAEFRREPGRVAVDNGLDVVLRHTNARRRRRRLLRLGPARDAQLAPRPARVQPDHRRRRIPSSPLPARRRADVARRGRLAALGVPGDLHASAMPIIVAGEPLGLLVFVFAEVEPHDDDNRRLLAAVSAAMGFALLRDRLAAGAARGGRRAGLAPSARLAPSLGRPAGRGDGAPWRGARRSTGG